MQANSTAPAAPNRCTKCTKKTGLLGFICRCGNNYCTAHRFSDDHGCTYDYRATAAKELSTLMVPCVGDKVLGRESERL